MEISERGGCMLEGQTYSEGSYACGDFFCVLCKDGQWYSSDDTMRESE